MDRGGEPSAGCCYYTVLGIRRDASFSDLRSAYRKLAKVSEEVERAIWRSHDSSLRTPSIPVGTSEESSLRLQFVSKLPAVIFTSSQIEAEDGTPLRIELVDGRTDERVTSGPLSSKKLEIVVLDGDFGSDGGEDWTEKEFNCNIIREREGKRPLITGELTVILQEGSGCLRNLIITDNSSWMRSRKFRLGARAVQEASAEIIIREARSEAFIIKNHRGGLNKKQYPPSLNDEVWRLKKIAKDGALHKRMTLGRINTVQDFLQLYEASASSLRNILGTGITNRVWETIVRHASTCVVNDNKMYAYFYGMNSILFNSVLKVAQATLDGRAFRSLDKLTHSQKILVQNLKRQAYFDKNRWLPFDTLPSIAPPRALTNLPAEPSIGLSLPLHHLDITKLNQEDRQLHRLGPQSHITMKIFNPSAVNSLARQDFPPSFSAGESSHHPSYLQGPFVPNIHSSPEEVIEMPSPISSNLLSTTWWDF